MTAMVKMYLIGVVVAFGGIFLLGAINVNMHALGEVTGVLIVPAALCYWAYSYLKRKEVAEKRETES